MRPSTSHSLEDKVDICQNAIDLAVPWARKARWQFCAVETVNSKMPATLDAAALCKMAERVRLRRLLDGPLAFDNAISRSSKDQGSSQVAGDPDILLAPDLEAGNILAGNSVSWLMPIAPGWCSAPGCR